jgi:hypothetical protein
MLDTLLENQWNNLTYINHMTPSEIKGKQGQHKSYDEERQQPWLWIIS